MKIIHYLKDVFQRCPAEESLPSDGGTEQVQIAREQHGLSRQSVHKGALKILYTLRDGGFSGYLVGGCVRDILLGRKPKDFDIATDAHPEQLKGLFRSCYLVGRRFLIAHVRIGKDVFEVSTFRAQPSADKEANSDQVQSTEQGLIVLDNAYGDLEQDVWRRDFTINALYYNIADFSLIDHTGGLSDLDKKLIRIIGDPIQRYKEDPIRMLRALRFAAKLDFKLESATKAPLAELRELLLTVPPARLYLEIEKLFLSGYAESAYDLLLHHKMFSLLFPSSAQALEQASNQRVDKFYRKTLYNTDQRISEGKYVTPAFMIAAFLWYPLQSTIQLLRKKRRKNSYQIFETAADEVLSKQLQRVTIPRRLTVRMREIWSLQTQLEKNNGKRPLRLLQHPRFRAAYDFLLLRAEVDDRLQALADWWTDFQEQTPQQRLVTVQAGTNKHGGNAN